MALKEIWSPLDSADVRFRQMGIEKHCEISKGSAISLILPFQFSVPLLWISNRSKRSLREKNSVSIAISCENQINGEKTAYFTILNGIVEKRVFETLL